MNNIEKQLGKSTIDGLMLTIGKIKTKALQTGNYEMTQEICNIKQILGIMLNGHTRQELEMVRDKVYYLLDEIK